MRSLADVVTMPNVTDADCNERVERKQAKLMRRSEKFEKADHARATMAVSSDASESGNLNAHCLY